MSEAVTLGDVRGMLKRWGALVREHGDSSIDGWGWWQTSTLARWQQRGISAGGGDRETALTQAERSVDRMDRENGRDLATLARLVKDLQFARRMVIAYVYVHELSQVDAAMQLGMKIGWVIEVRRDAEIHLQKAINALRARPFAAVANQ